MNLYLLTQEENLGYDTYDAAVVAARSECEARMIRPDSWTWDELKKKEYNSSTWASKPENVEARLIGRAKCGTRQGLVLGSFNAG